MREERLLERLLVIEKNPERRETQDTGRLVDSILNHLQRILNTRQGSVLIAEDFGVPDINHLTDSFGVVSAQEIERSIKQGIQKYEPRLVGVGVNFIPQSEGALSLNLKITARLAADETTAVVFNIVIGADGKIGISS